MVTVVEADQPQWDREINGEIDRKQQMGQNVKVRGTYHATKGLAKWDIHWPDGSDHSVSATPAYLNVLILLLQKYSSQAA